MSKFARIDRVNYCPFRKEIKLMGNTYPGVIIFVCLNTDHERFEEGESLPICRGEYIEESKGFSYENFPDDCPCYKEK